MIGSESLGSLSRTHGDEQLLKTQKSNPDGKNKNFEKHLKDESSEDGKRSSDKKEDTYQSAKDSEQKGKLTVQEEIKSATRQENLTPPSEEEEEKTEDTKSGDGSEHIDLTA